MVFTLHRVLKSMYMQQENIEKTTSLWIVKSEKIKPEEEKKAKVKILADPKLNMPPEKHRYIKTKKFDFL